jgi:hypothetical protein
LGAHQREICLKALAWRSGWTRSSVDVAAVDVAAAVGLIAPPELGSLRGLFRNLMDAWRLCPGNDGPKGNGTAPGSPGSALGNAAGRLLGPRE